MYLRFESLRRDAEARTNDGVFMASRRIRERWQNACPTPWQVRELEHLRDWFNTHLYVPDRLDYRPGRKGARSGICWFRDGASEHIARARYMALLIEDLGEPMVTRRAADPGTIIWDDAHQVVALVR